MADENEKFEEEEYSGEEEYISEYEEPIGATEIEPEVQETPVGASADMGQGGMSPQIRKMMTWGVIGLGTVLVALYLNFSEKAKRAQALDEGTVDQNSQIAPAPDLAEQQPEAPEPQTSSAAESPAPSVPAEAEATATTSPASDETTPVQAETTAATGTVSSEVAADLAQEKERVTALSQRVKENQSMISSVLIRLNTLEQSINSMSETLKSIDSKVNKPIIKPEVKKAAVAPKPVAKKRELHRVYGLKAILPGRAWIESASGDSRSIAVGDRIPGHGTVKMINSVEGYVLTTSGTMIVYGPGDF